MRATEYRLTFSAFSRRNSNNFTAERRPGSSFIIDVSELLAVVVAHHKIGVYSSTDQGGGKRRAISRGRQLHSLGDDGRLVHTNIPSVPGQMETNDTALAATTNNRVWAGASAAGDANRLWARRETFRT
jgi:hypothetical protein